MLVIQGIKARARNLNDTIRSPKDGMMMPEYSLEKNKVWSNNFKTKGGDQWKKTADNLNELVQRAMAHSQ